MTIHRQLYFSSKGVIDIENFQLASESLRHCKAQGRE